MKKVFLSLAYIALLLASYGAAQVSVTPLYAKLEGIEEGQSQATFEVFNGSSEPIRFRASFQPFGFQNGSLVLLTNSASDLSQYLRAAPLEFEVRAGSSQIIRVIAIVPPSAINGELRSALVVEPLVDLTMPSSETTEGNVTGRVFYTYRFVAQIYASAATGIAQLKLGEADFSVESGLRVNVSNSGTISGISNVVWTLYRGAEVVVSPEDAARFIVLPGENRPGVLSEDLTLPPGEYTLTGQLGAEDGGEPSLSLNPQPFTKTFTVK